MVRTAFVSTYPPRHSGVATFTHNLSASMGQRLVIALHPPGEVAKYPVEVQHHIRRDERADYLRTAHALERRVDVVSVQHDLGIWGGEDGGYVLDFVHALDLPVIATLHSIPGSPSPGERAVLTELVASVDATVAMSASARALLETVYAVPAGTVEVIPHGVPDLPLADPAKLKPGLGLEGREVLLGFGLLGPGKGYELAIDALPALVGSHPTVCLVIVGVTRPDILELEGEACRAALAARVNALGMEDHVRFVDRFVGRVELTRWLEAADVFITPFPDLDKVVSGTLSYAMGAGRAIVSTPFALAEELLADDRGVLLTETTPAALAAALHDVLTDDGRRAALGERAYAYARQMSWSTVGVAYRTLFERVAAAPPRRRSGKVLALDT